MSTSLSGKICLNRQGEFFKVVAGKLQWLNCLRPKGDRDRLEDCRRRRLHRSQSYFESVAGDWERIRKNYFE